MDEYIVNIQANVLPQIKFWHWQTTTHASHVALGDVYDALVACIDSVVESYQGRTKSRIDIEGFDTIQLVNFKDPSQGVELLGGVIEQTISQVEQLKKLDTFGDIINLLEELNGILGRTMYLLTLK